jgi:hypothetical protein
MTYHAIGGVDGLVGCHAWQPQQRTPQRGCHHGIGEIFCKTFDGRARYPDSSSVPELRPT